MDIIRKKTISATDAGLYEGFKVTLNSNGNLPIAGESNINPADQKLLNTIPKAEIVELFNGYGKQFKPTIEEAVHSLPSNRVVHPFNLEQFIQSLGSVDTAKTCASFGKVLAVLMYGYTIYTDYTNANHYNSSTFMPGNM